MTQDQFNADFETQEEKDRFIRGVMTFQVWGITLRKDPAEVGRIVNSDDGELIEEYKKLEAGEDHEFGRAMADHFGLPYQYAGDTIKLGRPYGPRYQKAWKELGVAPSDSERAAVSSAASFLKNVYENAKGNQ